MDRNSLFVFEKETGTILYYKGTANETIIVPEEIDGVKVKCIGEYAFCKSRKICVVILPHTIEKIGEGAFYECKSLISINIPKKVKKIERNTFYNDTNLEFIDIKNKDIEIDDKAFYRCYNLKRKSI